jgi:hypothetical protein
MRQSAFPSFCFCSVNTLKTRYPAEFSAFVKCLDKNDYRNQDCKPLEYALRDCWNKDMTAP